MGNLDVADAVDHPGRTAFAAKKLEPYSVNGKQGGAFKTEGALSFLRVFKAGHEVMYYRKFFLLPREVSHSPLERLREWNIG